jgi:hypothetical protein
MRWYFDISKAAVALIEVCSINDRGLIQSVIANEKRFFLEECPPRSNVCVSDCLFR